MIVCRGFIVEEDIFFGVVIVKIFLFVEGGLKKDISTSFPHVVSFLFSPSPRSMDHPVCNVFPKGGDKSFIKYFFMGLLSFSKIFIIGAYVLCSLLIIFPVATPIHDHSQALPTRSLGSGHCHRFRFRLGGATPSRQGRPLSS